MVKVIEILFLFLHLLPNQIYIRLKPLEGVFRDSTEKDGEQREGEERDKRGQRSETTI